MGQSYRARAGALRVPQETATSSGFAAEGVIVPLTGQCLVRLLPHEYGGLIAHETPSEEKAKPQQAVVMAVGKWKTVKSGHALLPDIHVGQRVLVSEYRGVKLTRALGEFLRLVRIDDVLAVLETDL